MRVGACVDDEWCVVWLLREVSKLWDVAVRCVRYSNFICRKIDNLLAQCLRLRWRVFTY
jgi:hypothetical protein